MLRVLLLFSFSMIGSNSYAQSVEERLQECIEQSQQIIRYAGAWKVSLEAIGERARPWEFAEIMSSYAYKGLLEITLDRLKLNDDANELVRQIEDASAPIDLRNKLIDDMVEEAFADESQFQNMAEYISACTDNFGGETYRLQDVIEDLEKALSEAAVDKETLEAKLRKDIEKLETELASVEFALERSETRRLDYERRLIELQDFDAMAYLDELVDMGALERNREIYEGKFSLAKLTYSMEISCLAELRDKGKLSVVCRDTLADVLKTTLLTK